MQYDPHLKKAMEEIKDILSRYDIAGVVVLHSPGFTEFLTKINPSYSCASPEGEDKVVFKMKKEHFNGDEKKRQFTINATANMLHTLSETTGRQLMPLFELSAYFDKAVDADHFSGDSSSHVQQNN